MYFNNTKEIIQELNRAGQSHKPTLFIISFNTQEGFLYPLNKINNQNILYDFNGISNIPTHYTPSNKKFYWKPHYIPFKDYQQSFDIVTQNLLLGNSFITNLTCATPIECNLSLKEIFYRANAKYKLWIKNKFVVFSPEIFIQIHPDRTIYSYPMKGTIDANEPDAKYKILNDKKESAEHATIVDLIRNDLSIIADKVTVSKYRYIDTITTHQGKLLQVSSEIKGILPENYLNTLGDIIFKLLPAGSISGAPKRKTVEIITEAENYDRGFYTGIMGIYDGKKVDSAVMIRFIEQNAQGKYLFKSGGGITTKSKIHNEYNEIKQKIYVPIY